MATASKSVRLPEAIWARARACAGRDGVTLNEFLSAAIEAAIEGAEEEADRVTRQTGSAATGGETPLSTGPKASRAAAKSSRTRSAGAAADKPAAARRALSEAETRLGVASVMDSVPLGNIRAPMQRARDLKR